MCKTSQVISWRGTGGSAPLLAGEHGLDGIGLPMCSLGAALTVTELTFLFQEIDSLEGKSAAK